MRRNIPPPTPPGFLRRLFNAVVRAGEPLFRPLDRPLSAFQHFVERTGRRLRPHVYWLLEEVHRWEGVATRYLAYHSLRLLGRVSWPIHLALLLASMTYAAIQLGVFGREWLLAQANLRPIAVELLETTRIYAGLDGFLWMSVAVGILCALTLPLVLVRRRLSLFMFKVSGAAFAALWLYFLRFIFGCPAALYEANQKIFNRFERNQLWTNGGGWWLLLLAIPLVFLFSLALRRVQEIYRAPDRDRPPLGDRVCENVRSHGKDPRFRTSCYWAVFAFLFILTYPFLMRGCGWEEPYAIPQGSGNPVIEVVRIKKPKKKPKKKFVLAQNSAFIFERIDIDDSQVLDEVDQATEDQYQATELTGKLGQGGGKKGGWPNGMPGKIRFIRLKYAGGDWDQDMGKGADHNLLIQLSKLTGFKIADRTEAKEVSRLRRFPKHRAPPFVFITGKGGISVSAKDVKTLRWYCEEEGGMIFADNGGGHFDSSFRNLVRRVFPGKQWVDIANDDILYRQPFLLPNGAPPLWHHSGNRALGIKHNGRWVVFYHQGDVNDAWKTGHSGADKTTAMTAYKLGINILNYAFTQYLQIHFGQ